MQQKGKEIDIHVVQKTFNLPSFSETFSLKNKSMSNEFGPVLSAASPRGKDIHISKLHSQRQTQCHPKKSTLKRHLEQIEQDKVLVQPAHFGGHPSKKLKSDWDSLFYNNEACGNGDNKYRNATNADDVFQKSKKRQSFLVRGKEMKSYFHLLEDDLIQDFLQRDKCTKITDKVSTNYEYCHVSKSCKAIYRL
ncbi:uncharacterized protein LOC128557227 [Mercenaria mercenaria]|uniref:uncharacterized protein LOC128557227 n=1 Tax=Mercenaria mercenaria TaxID=6596 RepID=UPI00234EB943|nr:uncharacterized protein LOC128557227 [Mercenaria mercenaria]